MSTTALSAITPDFAGLNTQLQTLLAARDTWKDLIKSSTGQTIIEMVAQIGELDQYMIEQQLRQAFIDTALTDSAVRAMARSLGVRLKRRTPTQIDVTITPSGAGFTIPAYRTFDVNGVTLFNRTAITVANNPAVTTATLYEGTIVTKSLVSDGSNFQLFKSEDTAFTVSDLDVTMTVSATPIPVTQSGLWNYPGTDTVSDTTTDAGELLLTFGSDDYGYKPGNGITVDVKYTVTSGTDAVNSSLSGKTVTPTIALAATIVSTSGLYGGGNEWSVTTMRRLSPLLFVSRDRATTETDFNAVAATYPGVQDAVINGQHKIAPTNVAFMNVARVTLLTPAPMTSGEWTTFEAWLRARTMYPVRFYRKDPVSSNVNITANVYCRPQSDLTALQAEVTTSISALFAREPGILNKNIFRSDIYRAIQSVSNDIEYSELLLPTSDVLLDVELTGQTITPEVSGGTLVVGNFYSYAITVVTAAGESLVKAVLGATLPAGNSKLKLDWNAIATATSYKVYGRGPTTYGLLATVTSPTYTDTGGVTPGGLAPTLDSAGIYYPALGTLSLTMRYTERD